MRGFLGHGGLVGRALGDVEEPCDGADADEEVFVCDCLALTESSSVAELRRVNDGRELRQRLFVGWVFRFKPSHRVECLWVGVDVRVARNCPAYVSE